MMTQRRIIRWSFCKYEFEAYVQLARSPRSIRAKNIDEYLKEKKRKVYNDGRRKPKDKEES